MDVTPRGMTTDVSRLKPNAVVPIEVTEAGMSTDVSPFLANALAPMRLTPGGRLTDASLCLNAALFLIEVTEGEIIRCLVPLGLVVIVKPSGNFFGALFSMIGSHESSRARQIV